MKWTHTLNPLFARISKEILEINEIAKKNDSAKLSSFEKMKGYNNFDAFHLI